MRFILVFSLFVLATKTYSQTVFTSALAPDFPTDIHIIDSDLYVGTYVGGYLAKIPLDDPSSITIVSDDFLLNGGPWKIDYDPNTNIVFVGVFPGIPGCYQINLNEPLPVDSELYADFNFFDGLYIDDTTLYYSGLDSNGDRGQLYTIDLQIGPASSELIYTDPEESLRNVIVSDNIAYYGNPDLTNNLFTTIYKLDLDDPSPQREYIATVGEGGLQSSLIHGNYLYLGLEYNTNNSKIVRLDLESTEIPIPQEIIVNNLNSGILGMAINDDNLYISEGGTGNILIYNDPILGSSESRPNSFELFPNPTNNSVFLKGKIDISTSYKIYGVGGEILLQGKYRSDGINFEPLSKGIYFVTIQNNIGKQTKKIIKN